MDPAILSATSALIGSLIGRVSTFAASWLTQHKRLRIQLLLQEAAKRETLYVEFIMEASKRLTEACGKQAEGAGLYAAMERMRLISSSPVLHRDVVRHPVVHEGSRHKRFWPRDKN
jgi:hypothetical protein